MIPDSEQTPDAPAKKKRAAAKKKTAAKKAAPKKKAAAKKAAAKKTAAKKSPPADAAATPKPIVRSDFDPAPPATSSETAAPGTHDNLPIPETATAATTEPPQAPETPPRPSPAQTAPYALPAATTISPEPAAPQPPTSENPPPAPFAGITRETITGRPTQEELSQGVDPLGLPPLPEFSPADTLDFGQPVPMAEPPPRQRHPRFGEPREPNEPRGPRDPRSQHVPPQRGPRPPHPTREEEDDDENTPFDEDSDARPGFRDRKHGRQRHVMVNPTACTGILEMSPKGFGFLRRASLNFKQHPKDVFILPDTVRYFGLREGMMLEGEACVGPRGPQMTDLFKVNGREPGFHKGLPFFEELTAINPVKRYGLETKSDRFTTRVIDMVAPIGRGQRGLIVAPPRTGKTTLLEHIAEAIQENYDDVHLMMLLIDERPEEVTELSRALPTAEIYASSNDNDVWAHTRIAEFGILRAKRLVEEGRHVFILLDSITRLARAYNNSMRGKGRTMSGGVDARALEMPRRLFAAARNTREAGSLTIVATALIETNSKADELIFQEFKGTGNMELVLDRRISEQYIYPAANIFRSGTRREELLLPPHQLKKINLIRRGLAGHRPVEAMERLNHFLKHFPNNAQMLLEIKAQGY